MSEGERRYLEDQRQTSDRDRHRRHSHYGNSEDDVRRRRDGERDLRRERGRGRSRDRAHDFEQDYSDDRGGGHRRGRSPQSRSSSRDDSYYRHAGDRGRRPTRSKRGRSRSNSRDERWGSMAAATPSSGYASSGGYGEGITGTHAPGMGGVAHAGAIVSSGSSWVNDHRHPSSGYHSSHSLSSYNSGYHSSQSVTGTWGAGEYDAMRSRERSRRARSRSPSTSGDERSRDYSHERTSRSRDSSRERGSGRLRSQSWDSREWSDREYSSRDRTGRKRSRNETAAASFSPLVHDNGGGKNSSRQQLSDRTPFDVISDPEYVSAVCGKAVEGDATIRLLPQLLDAMGMEIVQQQTLPPQIPSQNDGGKDNTDSTVGEAEALDTMNMGVRPKKKNPDHTPATVREFALTQVAVRSSLVGGDMEKEKDEGGEHTNSPNVLDEILSAFRLAAHHTVIYADDTLGDASSSSMPAERKQKIADITRRALMTCFVTLRGLILRLVELADAERNEGKCGAAASIGVIFGGGFEGKVDADGAPAVIEGVLLDIVPLLTQFIHAPLGEKRALSLLQNLLSLDETARKKKRSAKVDKKRQMSQEENIISAVTPLQTHSVIVRDSLMEVFVRQLLEQEGEAKRKLGRELLNVTASGAVSKTDVGAVAALRSKLTCPEVQDVIKEYRNSQTEEIARRRRIAEARNGGPSWDHEYQPFSTKRTSSRSSADGVREDLRLLRMDGCIYLSRIAARILTKRNTKALSATSAPKGKEESSQGLSAEPTNNSAPTPQSPVVHTSAMTPSSSSAKHGPSRDGNNLDPAMPDEVQLTSMRPESSLRNSTYERERLPGDDVQAQRERICSLAYFLFHTLMDHYAQAECDGCSNTITIHREDIPSAALACYLLAGKMEECPVKARTLLSIIKPVGLPPPPSARIGKCCKKLKDIIELNDSSTSGANVSLEWGKPTPEVMKRYELKLLSILGFDFSYGDGCIHPSAYIAKLGEILALGADAVTHVEIAMNDPSYTHSSLCLLGEPDLVAAAIYYLSCDKSGRDLHNRWEELLDEEEGLVKLVANYAWEVRDCVRAREKQWQTFTELKMKFDALRRSTKQHSKEYGSHSPNGDANDANMLAIPSVLDLDVDFSGNDSLPALKTLSDLVDEMNSYLAKSDDLDGPAVDEAMLPVETLEDGAVDAVAEVDVALPVQELRSPNGAAMDAVLSDEPSQDSFGAERMDAADDGLANASKCTPVATGSSAIDAKAAADGSEMNASSEAPAIEILSSGAATCANDNTMTVAPTAKSPIASTPVPPVPSSTTPAIMSESSKAVPSSAASGRAPPSPSKRLKMPMPSKRGLERQHAKQESQPKRRMLKMPSSRSIPTTLALQTAIAPPQATRSGKSQQLPAPKDSPSKSQSSRKTPNKKTSPNDRSSPGGNSGQSPPTQSKRKRQSPEQEPTSNQPSNQVNFPGPIKRQKANKAASPTDQSSRRRPKMLLGSAVGLSLSLIKSHLGVPGAQHRYVPQENEEEGEDSSSRPSTFDDNSPSPSSSPRGRGRGRGRGRATQEKPVPKPKGQNKKKKGEDMNSVSYHFTLDDLDSPSPAPPGRGAAQKGVKAKPKKKSKKSRGMRKGRK